MEHIVYPLLFFLWFWISVIYAFQFLAEQISLGIYISAKLDQEMFENSNRFEERFMFTCIDDLQTLLECEEKVAPRKIPENYSTRPLTLNIAFQKTEAEPKRKAGIFRNLKGLFSLKQTIKNEEVKKKKFDVLPYLKGLIFSVDSFGNSKDGEVEFSSDDMEHIELATLNEDASRKSSRNLRRSSKRGTRKRPSGSMLARESRSSLPKPSISNNRPSSGSNKEADFDQQSRSRRTFKEDTQDFHSRFSKGEEFRDTSSKDFRLLSVRSNLRNEHSKQFSDEDFGDEKVRNRNSPGRFKSDEELKERARPARVKTESSRGSRDLASRFIRGSVSKRNLIKKTKLF